MKILSIRVNNYKCFNDSGEIMIPSSFTIITGKNNAGKTALTQALSLTIEDKPHRSFDTAPTPSTPSKGSSSVKLKIEISVSEFYELVSITGQDFTFFKRPNIDPSKQIQEINLVFEKGTLPFSLEFNQNNFSAAYLDIPPTRIQSSTGFQFSIPSQGSIPNIKHDNYGCRMNSTIPFVIAHNFKNRIYLFKAERFNVGQYEIGANPNLLPDASNLAQALNNLQTRNPSKYEELISYVHTIFPDVQYITAPPHEHGGGVARINVWNVPVSTQRADLAIPLQESGTGLGQVLAILYVAISSEYPRPIIIDEPQSFLHPGAIRNLIGILQTHYNQHQYIVTTHSPIVLTSTISPAIIHLIKTGSTSIAKLVDRGDTLSLGAVLSDVGARLSDVFGADHILWVEGRTEEECFPIILNKILHRAFIGTSILGVLNVGDIQGKDASKIVSIYNKLSTGSTLIPPAIGYIFDRECKSDFEQADIIRKSQGLIHFISRRMFENYLIKPGAISSVISKIPDFPNSSIDKEIIIEWLKINGGDNQFFQNKEGNLEVFSDEWFSKVDGYRLLNALFLHLSGGTFIYEKVDYGIALTAYLCEHEPESFEEIAQLIGSILDKNDMDVSTDKK